MRIAAVILVIATLTSPAIARQRVVAAEAKDVTLKNGSTLRSDAQVPAAPIFLLHGGPGSSWLEQFPEDNMAREVAFYRTIADVIVFDQRGGGRSRPEMTCPDRKGVQSGRPFTMALAADVMRELAIACRERWVSAGVDLAAYNTVENAADVNDPALNREAETPMRRRGADRVRSAGARLARRAPRT